MAKVTPFRGWRYNPAMVDDMAAVLCPPYDLITPRIQQALMDRHPLNVIHLEAGEGLDWSADPAGRYAETAGRFEQWLRDGVLQQDAEPGYYLLRHSFNLADRSARASAWLPASPWRTTRPGKCCPTSSPKPRHPRQGDVDGVGVG